MPADLYYRSGTDDDFCSFEFVGNNGNLLTLNYTYALGAVFQELISFGMAKVEILSVPISDLLLKCSFSFSFWCKVFVIGPKRLLQVRKPHLLDVTGFVKFGISNNRTYINSVAFPPLNWQLHRVKVGGSSINPEEGTGMFQSWIGPDDLYLTGDLSSVTLVNSTTPLLFNDISRLCGTKECLQNCKVYDY